METHGLPCNICRQRCKTWKGLTYHLLRNHDVSVGRQKPKRNPTKHAQMSNLSPPSPPDVHSNVSRRDCTTSISDVFLLGETMRLTFPLHQVVECPIEGCRHSFRTVKWYITNISVKRNLTAEHKLPNRRVEYWCFHCNR
ncbi:hypothetical protein TNCT_724491 [Trichonephila clavata]|uniref:Uncharacterized protein n=1 Tax=Trichonephila clavata TaxID=2740835 RepID=A0A8X6L793_TRICU|nr:hypothetical protein TNCT_724491 [Trichonephila clavata]